MLLGEHKTAILVITYPLKGTDHKTYILYNTSFQSINWKTENRISGSDSPCFIGPSCGLDSPSSR